MTDDPKLEDVCQDLIHIPLAAVTPHIHPSLNLSPTTPTNLGLRARNCTMAEEPVPLEVQEGLEQPEALPANAEDRKAAKAMSKLDTRGEEEPAQKKEVDLKALNDAMKNLDVEQKKKEKPAAVRKEEAPKALVKVDPADVTLVVGFVRATQRITLQSLNNHADGTAGHVQDQSYRVVEESRCRRYKSHDSLGHGRCVAGGSGYCKSIALALVEWNTVRRPDIHAHWYRERATKK